MAGSGTFTPGKPKVRPGVYFNFKSNKPVEISKDDGITVIPFIGHPYGPAKTYIDVTANNINSISEVLGFDITDDNDNILLIREAFKACSHIKVYIAGSGGVKATGTGGGVTATAKYAGTCGNDIHFSVTKNVVTEKYDVSVYYRNELKYEYADCEKISDITKIDCPFVTFSTTSSNTETAPTEIAGVTLTKGADCTSSNGDFTTWLDSLDNTQFDSVCLPLNPENESFEKLATSFISKIKYLRENIGKTIRAAMPFVENTNYIGIDGLVNAPIVDGKQLTVGQATAFVAALSAASDELTSNTDRVYPGATGFDNENLLSHEAVEEGIKEGAFLFTLSEDGEVVVEYDINTLTNPSETQDDSYKKNRVIRTFDAITDRIKADIRIAEIDGTEEGYDMVDGLGASILADFARRGAIKNVEDGDFLVDRTASSGDSAVINLGVQPVDSIDKFYYNVSTN